MTIIMADSRIVNLAPDTQKTKKLKKHTEKKRGSRYGQSGGAAMVNIDKSGGAATSAGQPLDSKYLLLF